MTDSQAQTTEMPAVHDQGLFARFAGIFFSPRETMGVVIARPRWLGMFLLTLLIGVGPMAWFVTTGPGRTATIDQNEKYMKVFSFAMSPEQMKEVQDQARDRIANVASWKLALQASLGALIFSPIVILVLAGLFYFVFKVIMGGEGRFKPVFAVVVYAGAITAVKSLLLAPLNYYRESLDSATSLGVLLGAVTPGFDEGSFIARLLGSIDLFTLWWVFVLAVGLAVLFKKKTAPIAVSLFAIYAVFAVAIAGVLAAFAARS